MSTSHNTLSLLETRGLQTNVMLQKLNENFPPVTPNPTDNIETIMYRAGQRSVVEWIQQQLEE